MRQQHGSTGGGYDRGTHSNNMWVAPPPSPVLKSVEVVTSPLRFGMGDSTTAARHEMGMGMRGGGGEAWEWGNTAKPAMKYGSEVLDASPSHKMPEQVCGTWGIHLPGSVVERDAYEEAAMFVLQCKMNNTNSAVEFIRGMLFTIVGSEDGGILRGGPPYVTDIEQTTAQTFNLMREKALASSPSPRPTMLSQPLTPLHFPHDEIDVRMVSLVLLVPGKDHVIGHLIGKGGSEIERIERDLTVRISVEGRNLNIPATDRHVYIKGSVSGCTHAQRVISHRVFGKLLAEGMQTEVLRIVIPNSSVKYVIGKNGCNINRLQNISGARIQVDPESSMLLPGSIGRTIVLLGCERSRAYTQFMILRQLAEDRNVHPDWPNKRNNGGDVASSPPQDVLGRSLLGMDKLTPSPLSSPSITPLGGGSAMVMAQAFGANSPLPMNGIITMTSIEKFVPSFTLLGEAANGVGTQQQHGQT